MSLKDLFLNVPLSYQLYHPPLFPLNTLSFSLSLSILSLGPLVFLTYHLGHLAVCDLNTASVSGHC